MPHDAFYLVDVITDTGGEKITCLTYYGALSWRTADAARPRARRSI
jgi:hypothetical protein